MRDCGLDVKGNKGGGYVNMYKQTNYEAWKQPTEGESIGHIKKEKAKSSTSYLKQARRCEQYLYRLKFKMEGKGKEGQCNV